MYSRAYIEITNICNMNCSFCHGHSRPARKMTVDEFNTVLNKLQGATKYLYFHLMGEPLTHPDLPTFIKMAHERGFKPMITTNGTLLSRRGAELLDVTGQDGKTPCLHKINISLHSFEGENSEKYKKYLSEISDFAKKASSEGTIVVLRLWNKGFDGGNNDIALDYLRSSIDGEWAENTRGLRIREKLFLEWGDRFGWPDKEAELFGDEVTCYGLRDHFGILSDGTVVPCCLDHEGDIALGNLFETDLEEIITSPRAQAILQGFSNGCAAEELCRKCGYARTKFG